MRLARDGSVSALRLIVRRHNQRLYRVARAIVRDDTEAEDVMQEAYLSAFRNLAKFRADASLATWLTRIVVNTAVGHRRRESIMVPLDAVDNVRVAGCRFACRISRPRPIRRQAAARSQVRDLLEHAIDNLPEPFRVVFVMRMVEQLSIEETASSLGLREETVKTRLHRAKKLMRGQLETKLGSALTDTFPFQDPRCASFTDALLARLTRTSRTGRPVAPAPQSECRDHRKCQGGDNGRCQLLGRASVKADRRDEFWHFGRAREIAGGSTILGVAVLLSIGLGSLSAQTSGQAFDAAAAKQAQQFLIEGKKTFRFDTFGSEDFWGGQLRLHEAIQGEKLGGVGPGLSPKNALELGLKVDMEAVPKNVAAAIKAGKVNLNDPANTLLLLKANAVVGVTGFFSRDGKRLRAVGIQCALCHSTVDDAFMPGIGRRLDGWPNRDLDVGAIIALAPELKPFSDLLQISRGRRQESHHAWGPGKFDAQLNLDGKAFRPDGKTSATLNPPAFGLAGVNNHTSTGAWGTVTLLERLCRQPGDAWQRHLL